MSRLHAGFRYYVLSILLVAGLLLAAAPQSQAQSPVTITVGTTDFPLSLDPASAVDQPSWEVLNHLYTGLTRQIPGTLTFELALAANHTISPDGLTHTFTLREGITFDDGTPITAATFANSITRVIALGRPGADYINRYIAAVSVGEDGSLIFELHTPLPDFEALVAQPPFFPQHPDSYPQGDVLALEDTDLLVTNGPYQLATITRHREIILVANPAYTGPAPANDQIVLLRYDLPVNLREALLAGEVDVAWRGLAAPDLDAASADPGLTTVTQPNLRVYYLLLNHHLISLGNQDSFDDPAVRQAFTLLMDRDRSATLGFDEAVSPLFTLLPEEVSSTAITFPGYDWEAADAVLDEAGYSPRRRPINTSLFISTDTYGDLMAAATNEIRRGIRQSEIVDIAGINNTQTDTFISATNRGEYLSAIIGWFPHYPSPAGYLFPLAYASNSIPTGAGYGSEALDALLVQAALSTDPAEQAAAYDAAMADLLANADLIPLWQGQDTIVYQNAVTGVQVEANSWLHYDSLTR